MMLKNHTVFPGGMAEWFKAAVLKTVERKLRGFESYSLRQFRWLVKWPIRIVGDSPGGWVRSATIRRFDDSTTG
jgi:hypothetical protein